MVDLAHPVLLLRRTGRRVRFLQKPIVEDELVRAFGRATSGLTGLIAQPGPPSTRHGANRSGFDAPCCAPTGVSRKGNRQMRRVLNQAANAAVKAKGTIFAVVYRRLVPRLSHAQANGAITRRLCRLIWKILHERVRYEERGPSAWKPRRSARAR
jgi:hypothetical protein